MASWDEGKQMLNVWLSTQTPHRARQDLAIILGISEKKIRVVAPDVGGAFGGKASLYPEDALVALAALRLKRPVKWRGSRSEDFLAATQGRGATHRRRACGRCERQIPGSARHARLSARALAALQRRRSGQECGAMSARPVCLPECRYRARGPAAQYRGGRHLSRRRTAGSGDADGAARRRGRAPHWHRSARHPSPQPGCGRCLSLAHADRRAARFRRLCPPAR